MWGYVVLAAPAERPVWTQAALARAIGADKTRIIGELDDLQNRGLIQRAPDSADRRAHLLSVTEEGRRRLEAARTAVRQREDGCWNGCRRATASRSCARCGPSPTLLPRRWSRGGR